MWNASFVRAAGMTSLLLIMGAICVAPKAEANASLIAMPNAITRTASTMSGLPAGITVPSTAVSIKNVQNLSGWQICVASCANGAVPKTYKMTQRVASASMNGDGTGATMYESGTAFGDVMWHNLIGKTTATHFVMDMYIKIDHPENVQALEFATLKRDGLYWYKGSTQCNYRTGALRGYNTSTHSWQSLGASCVKATANTWQRVTVQYSIVGGTMNFEGISFNSATQTMSASLPAIKESTNSETISVHFQLDNANTTTGYTVAVDNWTVYSW